MQFGFRKQKNIPRLIYLPVGIHHKVVEEDQENMRLYPLILFAQVLQSGESQQFIRSTCNNEERALVITLGS